jgi:glycosyltransferase involved in cell wall biosynthesis
LKTKRIDVIHFHGNTALWFNILRLLGFYKKIPYIFHVHKSGIKNFRTFWKKANYLNKTKALFIWPLMVVQDFLTVKTANAIIAVSQSEKDIFINDYKCPSERVFVIENGVNVKRFAFKTKKDSSILNIIFVGILGERKNVEKIFSVIKVLAEKGMSPILTIVGRGDKNYISKLKSISKDLDIDKRIIWKGYISYLELPNIYAENDILLLLSHSEGLPKVILEALSCGLKVVSSRSFYVSGYLNEIVEWVDVEDDDEKIADQIIKALNKKVDFDRFRQEYSWSNKIEEIDKIYKRLIEEMAIQ